MSFSSSSNSEHSQVIKSCDSKIGEDLIHDQTQISKFLYTQRSNPEWRKAIKVEVKMSKTGMTSPTSKSRPGKRTSPRGLLKKRAEKIPRKSQAKCSLGISQMKL